MSDFLPPPIIPTDCALTEFDDEDAGQMASPDAVDADQVATTDAASSDDPTAAVPLPSEAEIREALRVVEDPELGISIMELGLVYDIIRNEAERSVQVNMTLTSPGCPLGPEMTSAVYMTLSRMPGVNSCQVELVWSPMWDPQVHASEETRIMLGLW